MTTLTWRLITIATWWWYGATRSPPLTRSGRGCRWVWLLRKGGRKAATGRLECNTLLWSLLVNPPVRKGGNHHIDGVEIQEGDAGKQWEVPWSKRTEVTTA